ncbi:MAG: hypothetical protein B7Z76_15825 [Acidiphilium sp. 20-67-58]|uniref:hypothetical protein n=1 Tax=Acidiphilium sp. 20-67-58 TaxID=1970291 RepID=UPI000BD4F5AE|nr:hypothetical protein [Acidiphilium sp. 20-67-58]OYV53898.1 MAG: hypothetical protein B7Z76_15825 [Acidiphilium sp. 20-67-58]
MDERFTPTADGSARSVDFTSQLGRVLLCLFRNTVRFLLVAVLDVLILMVRFMLWFRRILFWLGFFSALSCILNYEVHRLRLAAFALGAGILMMALSRASLLLNDRLRFWQLELHAWAQGWPVRRYAFTVLPPRR